uniref:Uncharacterized protein n=1 Tax=Anagyrus vladimiri reovirus TaxID=2992174 RepID=A0A9E8AI34_9REOV|nr:hypothetical protein [Anagyrus vladimiri reovirus]
MEPTRTKFGTTRTSNLDGITKKTKTNGFEYSFNCVNEYDLEISKLLDDVISAWGKFDSNKMVCYIHLDKVGKTSNGTWTGFWKMIVVDRPQYDLEVTTSRTNIQMIQYETSIDEVKSMAISQKLRECVEKIIDGCDGVLDQFSELNVSIPYKRVKNLTITRVLDLFGIYLAHCYKTHFSYIVSICISNVRTLGGLVAQRYITRRFTEVQSEETKIEMFIRENTKCLEANIKKEKKDEFDRFHYVSIFQFEEKFEVRILKIQPVFIKKERIEGRKFVDVSFSDEASVVTPKKLSPLARLVIPKDDEPKKTVKHAFVKEIAPPISVKENEVQSNSTVELRKLVLEEFLDYTYDELMIIPKKIVRMKVLLEIIRALKDNLSSLFLVHSNVHDLTEVFQSLASLAKDTEGFKVEIEYMLILFHYVTGINFKSLITEFSNPAKAPVVYKDYVSALITGIKEVIDGDK